MPQAHPIPASRRPTSKQPAPLRAAGQQRARVRAGSQPWLAAARVSCVCLLLAVLAMPAGAVEPDEVLQDGALEARARKISQELRCLVCQNQSIDDSNAALAKDLRILVRERLSAGDSDAAVLSFVEARYGEFVLLRPKLNVHTLLLWLAPLLVLVGAVVGVLRRARRPRAPAAAPLTEAEQRRLAELLQRELP
jgi:cytochrome c-type biogenesis protein CcmH